MAAIRKQEAEEERAEREAIEALRRADAAAAEEARRDAAVLAEAERADREAEAADRASSRSSSGARSRHAYGDGVPIANKVLPGRHRQQERLPHVALD